MNRFVDKYGNEFEEIEDDIPEEDESRKPHQKLTKKKQQTKPSRVAFYIFIAVFLVIGVGVTIFIRMRGSDFFAEEENRPRNFQPGNGMGDFSADRNRASQRTIVPLDDPIKSELDIFFRKFLDATKSRNRSSLSDCYDFVTIFKKVNNISKQRGLRSAFLVRDVAAETENFLDNALKNSVYLRATKIDITRMYAFDFQDGYLVYVDFSLDDRERRIWEFQLQRNEKEFRIVDSEDPKSGLSSARKLSDLAYLSSRGRSFSDGGKANIEILEEALESLQDKKLAEAESLLKKFDQNYSTIDINASFYQLSALLSLSKKDYEDTYSHCKQIKNLIGVPPPFVHYLWSVCQRKLGLADVASKSAKSYIDEFGEDRLGLTQLALAQYDRGLKKQAAQNAKKSLEIDPNASELLYVLASSGIDDFKTDYRTALSKMEQDEENYRELFDRFVEDDNYDMLDITLDEFDKKNSGNTFGTFYRAKVFFGQKKFAEAITLLKPIVASDNKTENTEEIEELYFDSLYILDKNQAIDACAKSTRPRYIFKYLGNTLLRNKSFNNLKRLVDLHNKNNPDDMGIHRFQGELAFHSRQWEKAFEELLIAFENETSAKNSEAITKNIFIAAFRSRKSPDHYRKWGDKKQIFQGMMTNYRLHHGSVKLERILSPHKHLLESREIIYYKALSSTAKRQFEKAVEDLEGVSKIVGGDPEEKTKPSELYFDLMLRLGTIEQGLIKAEDMDHAMVYLGDRLIRRKNITGLQELILAARREHTGFYWFDYYDGKLAELKGDWEKAAGFYRKGYVAGDDEEVYRDELTRALYNVKRPMEAYFLVEEKKETFAELAVLMSQDKNWTALNTLISAHKRGFSTDLNIEKFEAKILLAKNRFEEVITLLSPLITKDLEKAESFGLTALFAEAAVKAGQSIEVYRKAKEKDSIYGSLISQLIRQNKFEGLRQIAEEHRKNNPQYPWLEYHIGRAHEEKKDWTQAVKHYRKGHSTVKAEYKESYRDDLVRAEFYAGNIDKILDEFSIERAVFEQLAKLAYDQKHTTSDKTIGLLKKLIERWAKETSINHPFCLFWTARIHLLKKEHQEVAKIFQTHFQKLVDDNINSYATERELVYALLEEKNFEQATKYAILGYQRVGDPWLPMLAAIASGDLKQSIEWIYDFRLFGNRLKLLYENKHVSDVLNSTAFEKFRKKYPPPKKGIDIVP